MTLVGLVADVEPGERPYALTSAGRGFAAVRLSLARSRERGVPFSRAWKTAMRTTHPNGKTYAALKATKPEWRAAYERDPATPREAAVGRLAELWSHRTA